MRRGTLLFVVNEAISRDAPLSALKASGYQVVSTKSAMQAIALLYILHPIAAVLLDHRAPELTKFDVARSLKAVRPDVPIVLLCCGQIDQLPPYVDACVSTTDPPAKVTAELQSLLTAPRPPSEQHTMVI